MCFQLCQPLNNALWVVRFPALLFYSSRTTYICKLLSFEEQNRTKSDQKTRLEMKVIFIGPYKQFRMYA